jgi:chromosome segregation ATPase
LTADLTFFLLQGLRKQLKSLDYEQSQRDKKNLVDHISQLEREKSAKNGRLGEIGNTLEDLTREVNEKRFLLAEKKYRDKAVEKYARDKVVRDLNRYFNSAF